MRPTDPHPVATPGLAPPPALIVPTADAVERRIYRIRDRQVMLDADLAELYGVRTKALNQAVRRNLSRFPADFMLELTTEEAEAVRRSRSQSVTLKRGTNVKYPPLAFTDYGVAMLSSVLRSERAVQMNIAIIRAFSRLREMAMTHTELGQRIDQLEIKYDGQFARVFDALRALMRAPTQTSEHARG